MKCTTFHNVKTADALIATLHVNFAIYWWSFFVHISQAIMATNQTNTLVFRHWKSTLPVHRYVDLTRFTTNCLTQGRI